MKEEELRIGNLVYFQDKILNFEFESGWNFEFIKSIPLTEEWLLKLGGIKSTDSFGGYLFYYPNGNGMRIKNNEWSSQHITVKVEFVHQLQNLFFILTGKELLIS